MVDPIQAQHRETMNVLAGVIDHFLNGDARPRRIGFVLLLAEFGKAEGGRVYYISNGERDDMVSMLRELLGRFEGRVVDTPGAA